MYYSVVCIHPQTPSASPRVLISLNTINTNYYKHTHSFRSLYSLGSLQRRLKVRMMGLAMANIMNSMNCRRRDIRRHKLLASSSSRSLEHRQEWLQGRASRGQATTCAEDRFYQSCSAIDVLEHTSIGYLPKGSWQCAGVCETLMRTDLFGDDCVRPG